MLGTDGHAAFPFPWAFVGVKTAQFLDSLHHRAGQAGRRRNHFVQFALETAPYCETGFRRLQADLGAPISCGPSQYRIHEPSDVDTGSGFFGVKRPKRALVGAQDVRAIPLSHHILSESLAAHEP